MFDSLAMPVLFWQYSFCQEVTAVKPINQSKLTNEGKDDERGKHETEKVITSVEWGQRWREKQKQIHGHRERERERIKETWSEPEEESTAMNSSTGRNSQVRRGGMDGERAEVEE